MSEKTMKIYDKSTSLYCQKAIELLWTTDT